MSVHSEVNNFFKNKSGNAPAFISSRSGDKEEGNEYFDLRADPAPNSLEVLEENDSQTARQAFLQSYFKLLKERLNRFEFEYVKQLYVEGQPEKVIIDRLGINPKKFKRGLQQKLVASAEDIGALVAASEWEDAELFTRFFLSPVQGWLINETAAEALPKTVKGFGNLIDALARHRYLKLYKKGWYKQRESYNVPPRLLFCKNLQERVQYITSMFKWFNPEFLKGIPEAVGVEIFYSTTYELISNELLKLYRIVVERVPIVDIMKEEQAERARKAEEYQARRAAEVDEDEEGAPVGAAV